MRLFRSRRLWLLLLAPAVVAPPPRAGSGADPAALVEQLGADEYARREAAGHELKALGEKALPAVRDATGSANPEIRRRAESLLFAILVAASKSKSTGLEMRPLRARTFDMGSQGSERNRRPDELQHPARIPHAFLIGAYEVTQAEYEKVVGHNPSWFAKTGGGKGKVGADTSRFPVEQVTWFDALHFCNRLSTLDGYEPYYKLTDVKTAEKSITSATVTEVGGGGYRLPTEAEWEYACRGTTDTPFHYGLRSGSRSLNAKVLVSGGYGAPDTVQVGRTTVVGTYPRNRFGLYDAHGNVGEWCADWYDKDYYATAPEIDPRGPKTGTHRVLRGGSWLIADTSCRSAARAFHPPGEATYYTGFRVARTP